MTALADAVRSKADKYTTSTEIPNEKYVLKVDVDTREMIAEEYAGTQFYSVGIDLKTALGDKFDLTTKLYIECNYESFGYPNTGCPFKVNMWHTNEIEDGHITGTGGGANIIPSYTIPPIGEHKIYIDYKYKDKLYSYIEMGAYNTSIYSDGYFKGEFKIWACDSNNEFIVLKKYTPAEMIETINDFNIFPNDNFLLTGNCNQRFNALYGWDWALKKYIDKWYSENIDSATNMFAGGLNIEKIPFDLNFLDNGISHDMSGIFDGAKNLKEIPIINNVYLGSMGNMFINCANLREIPDDKWNVDKYYCHTYQYAQGQTMFKSCNSMRYITPKLLNNLWSIYTSSYSSAYYGTFQGCFVLDDVVGWGVSTATYTSNMFVYTFESCSRLKDITFLTNEDGTTKTANWKSQTIDLTKVGCGTSSFYILNYNSGITADKEVYDDVSYQALKNDPDWFTTDINYSRYNHDSAVNTINSLPDCSAYGTNTIKFTGAAGAKTDGGAINTLTDAEIAVAAAKGWTISFA